MSASPSTPAAPKPAGRPYVKLFTLTRGGRLEDTSDSHLRFIAHTYGWINSHGGSWRWPVMPAEMPFGRSAGLDDQGRSVGDRLRALNPQLILTNYCNGSYTNQDGLREAMQAERQIPLAIAVHDTGARLVAALDAHHTEVRLHPPPETPPGAAPGYPFLASTTDQEHSRDKQRYVAWLRLDDEILRIDSIDAAHPPSHLPSHTPSDGQHAPGSHQITLRVRRGTWGTAAAPHAADTPVLQPVYCGSRRPDGQEYYLSGLPGGESPQRALRYVFMQQRPQFWDFLGERMQETVDDGLSGPWFDCAVSSWINHANACGTRIRAPYDVDLRRPLDRDTYREYQQRKHDALFQRFPGAGIYVNWFFPRHYWGETGEDAPAGAGQNAGAGWTGGTGGGSGGHERWLLSGENGHHPLSGGAIEMYANERFMDWHDLLRMHLDMRDQRFCVVSWIKRADNRNASDFDMPLDYQLFAYATHLLVYEPHLPLYFGPAVPPGQSPAGAAGGRPGQFLPAGYVYWDLGPALERFATASDAAVPESPGLYRRRFARGQVLINPSSETLSTTLAAPHYDPHLRAWLDHVTLDPLRAALLLHS